MTDKITSAGCCDCALGRPCDVHPKREAFTSKQQVDPSVLWQWLHDLANKAGDFDALMLKAAADIVGASKIVGVCEWTRLPDLPNPLELYRVQFKTVCSVEIARGAHPIYPDNCPHCHGRVKIVSPAVETTTELAKVDELLQTMIVSSQVYVEADGTITGYKIKTGALHKLVGLRPNLFFPQNLPLAVSREIQKAYDDFVAANPNGCICRSEHGDGTEPTCPYKPEQVKTT
jgi:hypothetical protein